MIKKKGGTPLSKAPPRKFRSFHLAEKIRVEPLGKLSHSWAGGKVPEGARVFLYSVEGHGTTPFYVYARKYPQHKNKLCYVLDFRLLRALPPEAQIDAIIHHLGKGMVWARDIERVVVKYRGGWKIEKEIHAPDNITHKKRIP